MSKSFWENFLNTYNSMPCLWKIISADYSNREKKKNICYMKLLDMCLEIEPKATKDFVLKKKINACRTTFRKEHKKVIETGTDDIYTLTLWYYTMLLPTVDEMIARQSRSTFGDVESSVCEEVHEVQVAMEKCIVLFCPEPKTVSGNMTTMNRIRCHIHKQGLQTLLFDPKVTESIKLGSEVKGAVAIHAWHCATVLSEITIPYILILGGTDLYMHSKKPKHILKMTTVISNAQAVVTFGPSMTRKCIEIWPFITKEKLREIPQAIVTDPSDFSLECYLERMYGVTARHIFLLVSGIRPVKDILYLVSTFADWHCVHKDCILCILGPKLFLKHSLFSKQFWQIKETNLIDEKYYQTVEECVKSSSGVLLLPPMYQNDTFSAMRSSCAVVNSSLSEGMCSALLEAMSIGTVVIARDIPGNRDIIENKKTGFLYSTPQEFIENIELLLSNPVLKQHIVQNAKTYIQKKHHWSSEESTYSKLINTLLYHAV